MRWVKTKDVIQAGVRRGGGMDAKWMQIDADVHGQKLGRYERQMLKCQGRKKDTQ